MECKGQFYGWKGSVLGIHGVSFRAHVGSVL